MLATGRSDSGKTILSLLFLQQGLQLEERGLLLSTRSAEDLAIYATSLGIPADVAIDAGNLMLLEYNDFVPGRDREDSMLLPPEGFQQLQSIIEEQAIQRVAIDTILPWVAIPNVDRMAEHVFSFVRAFDRLGTTSLFTIPKPVSSASFRLRRLLEQIIPVSVTLNLDPETRERAWSVNKYLGADQTDARIKFIIQPGGGFVQVGEEPHTEKPANTETAKQKPEPEPQKAATIHRASFATILDGDQARVPRSPEKPAPSPPAAEPSFVPSNDQVNFASFILDENDDVANKDGEL